LGCRIVLGITGALEEGYSGPSIVTDNHSTTIMSLRLNTAKAAMGTT
jgi:hypothetical protein